MNTTLEAARGRRRPRRPSVAQMLGPQVKKLSSLFSAFGDTKIIDQVTRVLGPYEERSKFRLCLYKGDERLKSLWCHSREEADGIKQRLFGAINDESTRTVSDTLDEYLADLRRQGLRDSSLRTLDYRLKGFLPLDLTLGALTSQKAQEIYQNEIDRTGRFGKPIAAATHRAGLKSAKMFARWVVERRYLDANPFEKVKPSGRVNSGKPQLRLDEARKLNDYLIKRADAGDEGATAVLMQLVMGLRSNEVLSRKVRDLDNDGRELCIESGKTKNARRGLKIESEPLRRLLLKQTVGKGPEDLLFGAERDRPHSYDFLWHRLRKYCADAGVPKVCPHSLRGLHSTIAHESGATSGLLAAALGHGSFAITAKHYIDPSALANTQLRKVSAALSGGIVSQSAAEQPAIDPNDLAARLRELPPEQLAALFRSVAQPS